MVVCSALCGTISGTVRAEGKSLPGGTDGAGKYDSRKFKFVEKVDYEAMRDFVVYIVGTVTNTVPPERPVQVVTSKKISQRGAMFSPHVLPVMAGTTVEWPNNDEIFHNVFSISETKSFDLDLYKGNPPDKRVIFDKAGRVDVFCSIHSTMNCVVLVLENPFFDTTDDKGCYSIDDVPAGTYKLRAWHERLPAQEQEITVATDGEVKVDFVLGIKNLPKY